jgi:FG-GAP repeat
MKHARNFLVPSLTVLVLAGDAAANDTLFTTAAQGAWSGLALARTGDVDGDGRRDLAESDGMVVRWISSANGSIVRSVGIGAYPGGHIALADAGDLDGDGVSDIAVGRVDVRAYSGATGLLLWQITSTSLGFGHALARIDDRDGDGRPEILVGVAEMLVWGGGDVVHVSYEGDGRAEVRSGASGALLSTIVPPAGSNHGFGGSLALVDDIDGDARADLAIASFYQPESLPGPWGAGGDVRLYSGVTLAPISSFPAPANLSTRVTVLRDLDGDGVGELALARIWESVQIVSLATGATLRTHAAGTPYDRVGQSVVALGDLDGDGVADYAIGAPQPQQFGPFGMSFDLGPGVVRVYSGATGAEFQTLAGTLPYGRFGWSLAAAGDQDGDGIEDLFVGSPYAGRVVALSGSTHNSSPNAYCVGGLHSVTQRAQLAQTGTTSIAANNLVLVATNATPGWAGFFVYGLHSSFSTFGGGWSCVGSPYFRVGPIVPIGSGGSATRALDLSVPPASGGAGAISAGTTAYFQFFFRNPPLTQSGRNASNALAITFVP